MRFTGPYTRLMHRVIEGNQLVMSGGEAVKEMQKANVLFLRSIKVQTTFLRLKSGKHTAGDSAVKCTIVLVLESQPLVLRY